MTPDASATPSCLLCGGSQAGIADSVASEDLRKAWRALGVDFGDGPWGRMGSRPTILLYQCRQCGFRFCDPTLAGDGSFYAELERQRTKYYPTDVPEFTRTLRWGRKLRLRAVLDIGCGDGAFLDQARAAGLATSGLELNRPAAEAARSKGHEIDTRALEAVSVDSNGKTYDLVTLFQVLEHVPDPAAFIRAALTLLQPGGYLSVAVPHEGGIYRICPREPHEWPPHHVSRWRVKDLERLGRLCAVEVVRTGTNRLSGNEIKHFWKLHNAIAKALGERVYPGGDFLPAVLGFTYRKLGFKFIVPRMGTSVYAFYRKP